MSSAAIQTPWPWSGEAREDDVSLLLLGDVNIQYREDPATALTNVMATLNAADLVYANLEGLLVPTAGPHLDIPDKGGWQHVGPDAVTALKAGNIKVVGVANNVAFGVDNIMQSLAVLDGHGIAHTGAGANVDQAHSPAIIEVKGVRIGFLQYTAKWYAQDRQIATESRPGVARILSPDGNSIDAGDLERMVGDVRSLRGQVDVVIVSSHNRDGAGRPSSPEVLAEKRELSSPPAPDDPSLVQPIVLGDRGTVAEPYQAVFAHAAIDAGADLVFGHGSHVVQRVEVHRGRPVLYCLGNFAMDWVRMTPNRDGLIARVLIKDKKVSGVGLVPLTRDDDTNNVRLLEPAHGPGAALMERVRALSGGSPLSLQEHEFQLALRSA